MKPGLWVALAFAAMTLVGLAVCADYGLPCDEPAEQEILRENMLEYALAFQGEDSAAALWYRSLGVEPISQSVERDHGQCAYYPAAALLAMELSPDVLTALWHAYTWLWFMAGVWALYAFGRHTGLSRPFSLLGALLLWLSPRFFAEGHYNNKDMVLLSLVLLTLWLGMRLLKRPTLWRGVWFSLAGAMAANTKIAGAFAWGVMGLCAVALLCASRRWNRQTAVAAVGTVALFALFYAALTPALWASPGDYFSYGLSNASGFSRWPGVVVFRGMVWDQKMAPLPWYYLPWTMLVTLPLYVPVLGAAGQLHALQRVRRERTQALRRPETLGLLAATLCWAAPLAVAMLIRPIVYNGWRHFYFVYAGVAPLAAHGAAACYYWLRSRSLRRLLAVGLSALLVVTGVGIAREHPYQFAYYNFLAGSNPEADMELDYWDVSTLNALRQLAKAERNEALPLVLGSRDPMSWFGVEHAYEVLSEELRQVLTIAQDENAPYLFFNTTYARIYGVPAPEGYHALLTLESYGNVLCTVYERDLP